MFLSGSALIFIPFLCPLRSLVYILLLYIYNPLHAVVIYFYMVPYDKHDDRTKVYDVWSILLLYESNVIHTTMRQIASPMRYYVFVSPATTTLPLSELMSLYNETNSIQQITPLRDDIHKAHHLGHQRS